MDNKLTRCDKCKQPQPPRVIDYDNAIFTEEEEFLANSIEDNLESVLEDYLEEFPNLEEKENSEEE